jgi:hypothetical protein
MAAYTVCFSGTACSRDEGEATRYWDKELVSDHKIYDDSTGYIPVRMHREISARPEDTHPSVTIRGAGESDWYNQEKNSDPLLISGPLRITKELLSDVKDFSNGQARRSKVIQVSGADTPAHALHAANLAAKSGADVYNFIGHSRGGVSTIMAAWFLYAYGGPELKKVPINIFAIDPVPGPGEWYGILTQLPPNVANYVGVYAWDHTDIGFAPVVPRPNARMSKQDKFAKKEAGISGYGVSWKKIADDYQLTNPLKPANLPQPDNYHLYMCRGRHGTVAGNSTSDGRYVAKMVSEDVASVPRLVYKMARAYLTRWGTVFHTRCAVRESARSLRKKIHTNHTDFDNMAGGVTRTARLLPLRPDVRRVSSSKGSNSWACFYLEDVVGDPPYKFVFPCSLERKGEGWVKWTFL